MLSRSTPGQQRLDLLQRRHRRRSTRARHRDTSHRAGKAHRLQRLHASRQGCGEAAVEGVSRAGGFDHWSGADGGDMLGAILGVQQRTLVAERDDDRADALFEITDALLMADAGPLQRRLDSERAE